MRTTPTFHKDVYYLDGMKWSDVKVIVDSYSELLTHDGEINFGFGSHEGHNEVFVGLWERILKRSNLLVFA